MILSGDAEQLIVGGASVKENRLLWMKVTVDLTSRLRADAGSFG